MLQSYSLPAAICRVLFALLGWVSLVLQFFLACSTGKALGQPFLQTASNFFSYFTILTNLLATLSLSILVANPRSNAGKFFSRPTVQTAIAGNILIVCCVYNMILAKLWNPQGAQWLADVLLHTNLPLFYLVYWILFVPKGTLGAGSPLPWILYPLAYFLYSLARGAVTGWYPYPFIDATSLGYPLVLRNSFIVLAAFLVVFYILVLVDRGLRKASPVSPP